MSYRRRMRGRSTVNPHNMGLLVAAVVGVTAVGAGVAALSSDDRPEYTASCVDRVTNVRAEDSRCPADFGDPVVGSPYAWSYQGLPSDDDGSSFVYIGDVGRPHSGGTYVRPGKFKPGKVYVPPAKVAVTPGMPQGVSTVTRSTTITRGGLGVTSGSSGSSSGS